MNLYIKKDFNIPIIISIILLFLYVYPLYISFIPLSSRIIYSLFGIIAIVIGRYISLSLISPLKGLIPIFLMSIISGIFNRTFDFFFAKYCISVLLFFFASYFVYKVLHSILKGKVLDLDFVAKYFIIIVTIQSVLSIIMFVQPSFSDLLYTIFKAPEAEQDTLEENLGLRLIGLGSYFFSAGVIHGLSLIFIVYLYIKNRINTKWIFIYLFNFFVGVMMARTTVIGFILSLFLMFIWKPLNIYYIKLKIKWGIFVVILFIIFVFAILAIVDEEILKWAFEFFYNYSDYGSFESSSTNELKEMYVFPDNFHTYIIGDGLYNMPNGTYYMSTDVGYLRLLFYGGLPIICCYYFFSYYLIKNIIKYYTSNIDKYLLYILLLYILVLNFKGLADINAFLILIYTFSFFNSRNISNSVDKIIE